MWTNWRSHTLCDCPQLKLYWEGIGAELTNILQINIKKDPLIFVLGVLPHGFLCKERMYLLKILIMVAKKMITVSWWLPPTVDRWKERLISVYTMENSKAQPQHGLVQEELGPADYLLWANIVRHLGDSVLYRHLEAWALGSKWVCWCFCLFPPDKCQLPSLFCSILTTQDLFYFIYSFFESLSLS